MTQQIIVCDDEPHIIRAISLKFMRADFDVQGATDVESCWRLLHRYEPDSLLIVDRSIASETDGLDLVRRIRADEFLADLRVILLTDDSNGFIDQAELLADLRIAEIVTKPFSPRELLATVSRMLDPGPKPHVVYGNYRASDCRL